MFNMTYPSSEITHRNWLMTTMLFFLVVGVGTVSDDFGKTNKIDIVIYTRWVMEHLVIFLYV
jgi:hypothetical protein